MWESNPPNVLAPNEAAHLEPDTLYIKWGERWDLNPQMIGPQPTGFTNLPTLTFGSMTGIEPAKFRRTIGPQPTVANQHLPHRPYIVLPLHHSHICTP